MIHNSRFTTLDKPFHDSFFLKESSTGIHYMRKSEGLILEEEKYRDIIPYIQNNLFILENIFIKDKLLQRLTFPKEDISFIRMGKKSDLDVGTFNTGYSENGFDFSYFIQEHLKENYQEVLEILRNTSKQSMRDTLVGKNDPTLKRFFKYQGRIGLNNLDDNLNTGFYSVIQYKYNSSGRLNEDLIDNTLLQIVDAGLYRTIRATNNNQRIKDVKDFEQARVNLNRYVYQAPSRDITFNGVLEVYNTEKYIFQFLYVSYPFTSQMNRFFDKEKNGWSNWRHIQYLYDLHGTLINSPGSNLAKRPIEIPKLAVANRVQSNLKRYGNILDGFYRFRGYKTNSHLRLWQKNFSIIPDSGTYRSTYSPFFTVYPNNHMDYSYGYVSKETVRTAEEGFLSFFSPYNDRNGTVIDPPEIRLNKNIDLRHHAIFDEGTYIQLFNLPNTLPNPYILRNPFNVKESNVVMDLSTDALSTNSWQQGLRFLDLRPYVNYNNPGECIQSSYLRSNIFLGYINGVSFVMDQEMYDLTVERQMIVLSRNTDESNYLEID